MTANYGTIQFDLTSTTLKLLGSAYITNNSNNALTLQLGDGSMQANFVLLTTPYGATNNGLFYSLLYDGTTPGWEYCGGSGSMYGAAMTFNASSGTLNYSNTAASGSNGGAATVATVWTIDKNGNMAVGGGTPDANAILDVQSTTKAFAPPRMTTTQRDAIASPFAGMVVFNTTTNVLNFHNGSVWGAV